MARKNIPQAEKSSGNLFVDIGMPHPEQELREHGYELRRPEADYLRDGVYELRVSLQGVQYRMLYFFHGNVAAVVSHGIVKKQKVPPKEIDLAVRRKGQFEQNPRRYTYEEG